jgi:DNA-binding NtrC family response regulator
MVEPVHQDVLIVTQDSALVSQVQKILADRGLRGFVSADGSDVLDRADDRQVALVLIDGSAFEDSGFALLRRVRTSRPELLAVMVGPGDRAEPAVRAMREGCQDYFARPIASSSIQAMIDVVLPNHEVPLAVPAENGVRCLRQIAGRSPRLLEIIRTAARVAPTSVPVLITGESGTGKELIARYVHQQSNRSHGPYVEVNCAALSESLLESELFGHERGAFTGAVAQRKGRFEMADGGTLLLDEISETGPRLQAELLRVLEEQGFERVGGSESVRVDVRVLCTSNRDLEADVGRGRFRLDLYYRINGVRLQVPPLRHRIEDIPHLVWHFVNEYAPETRRNITDLDRDMLEAFRKCPWPGNVRQLRSAVRTAMILGEGSTLSLAGAHHLRAELARISAANRDSLALRDVERQAIF